MAVQAGSVIGSIFDPNDELCFETYVTAGDRPRVSPGDDVDGVNQGLLQAEYGVLKGQLTELDADATQDPEQGSILFKAKVIPSDTQLTNRKGETAVLGLGMTSEIRIKYDKVTNFKYLMEALGIPWQY